MANIIVRFVKRKTNETHLAAGQRAGSRSKSQFSSGRRSPFLLFPVRESPTDGEPRSDGGARHQEEGRLRRGAQSSASLLISYIGGSQSMCTRVVWNWCANKRTYVSNVSISGGRIIGVRLRANTQGESELSVSRKLLVIHDRSLQESERERAKEKERER